MLYAKALREKLDNIAVQMRGILDAAKTENNRRLTTDEATRYDNMLADFEGVEKDIARAERADKIEGDLRNVSREEIMDHFNGSNGDARARRAEATPHQKAFSAYLRKGVNGLSQDQVLLMQEGPAEIRNAAQSSSGSAGGYLIPSAFSNQLERAMKWFGGIDGFVRRISTTSGNTLAWPTVNDTSNKGRIIGENVQVTNTAVTFGTKSFGAYIGSSDLVLVPLSLANDSEFDMDSLVASLLGERLGRLFNYECTVGSGSSEPTGIVTAAVAAGLTRTFATGETATLTFDDLTDLEFDVDQAYRDNPSTAYMFSDKVLKVLRKLKDGDNRPIWMPGLTASVQEGAQVVGYKPTINNHPYIVNNDMAVPAADADSILFGDFSKFIVRDVKDTTLMVLRERYADFLQVGYLAFRRFDSNLIDAGTHPVVVGIQSHT
jgi:HK97 family phage major capsid protein